MENDHGFSLIVVLFTRSEFVVFKVYVQFFRVLYSANRKIRLRNQIAMRNLTNAPGEDFPKNNGEKV